MNQVYATANTINEMKLCVNKKAVELLKRPSWHTKSAHTMIGMR